MEIVQNKFVKTFSAIALVKTYKNIAEKVIYEPVHASKRAFTFNLQRVILYAHPKIFINLRCALKQLGFRLKIWVAGLLSCI